MGWTVASRLMVMGSIPGVVEIFPIKVKVGKKPRYPQSEAETVCLTLTLTLTLNSKPEPKHEP